ncbi:hypothetical protein CFC21_102742 [Triticum aestivum]|uniref:Auxin-responsive protein n=3 Tax=Triticum TaxID=4564 RepID=A0A9R0ZZD5_TRITD|nr:hypothetical protein CFC21_102742 [Triticum aestivum]VAI86900.1 unnamed protein product [Triticum turgidum subsp. durum]
MMSSKKLAQLSKKWQGISAIGRRRVTTTDKDVHPSCSSVAGKGHFVVYSSDGRRFEIPIACLRTMIFEELLRMSQEEFGFTSEGRITLPCDMTMMEYVMCLLRREASEDVERALLSSIITTCHHPSRMMQAATGLHQQFAVRSSSRVNVSRFFFLFLCSIFFPGCTFGAHLLCNVFPRVPYCGCTDGCM